jgi:formyl-CoA transferase
VATLDDVVHDEQMRASGALVPLADARAGAALTVSSPLQVGAQDKVPATLAPEIGQHTVDVLRAAGVDDAEIKRLLAAGVIVQAENRDARENATDMSQRRRA